MGWFNLAGELVFYKNGISSDVFQVEVEAFVNGLYILHIQEREKMRFGKFVKNWGIILIRRGFEV